MQHRLPEPMALPSVSRDQGNRLMIQVSAFECSKGTARESVRNRKDTSRKDLPLAALALGIALADLVTRVALADYVDSSTATHYLTIRVTILECTNR